MKSGRRTCSLRPHRIPDVAVEIVVAGEQEASRLGERHRSDAADDVVVRVHGQLLVGSNVEQAASGVVGSRCKRVAVGKELNRQTNEK